MVKNLRKNVYVLLRKSEGTFKTNMIYLVKGGFWLTMGQAFTSISSFLLAIAFANFLPKESYGIYKYVLTVIAILSIANLRNMNIAITQSVAQGNEGTAMAGIREKIKWGLLSGLGAVLVGGYYFLQENYLIGSLLLISAPFLPFKDSYAIYVAILNGKKDFKRIAIYGLIPSILNTIGTILIIYFTKNIYWLLFFYLGFWTVTNYFLLKKTRNLYHLNNLIDQKSINYGKHASFTNIINTVAGYFDKLLIFHYLGAASTAIYSIGLAPVSQINGAVGNINSLAVPKFSELTTEKLKFSLQEKQKKIIVVTLVIAILYIIFAKFMFGTFFPKYMEAIEISRILAISIPLTIMSRFRFTAIQSRFDKKIFNTYTLTISLIQVVLNFIGVYFWGLLGIAASYVLISFCQYLTTAIIVRKL